ncbi:MAG: endonuclease domain-containing protein [Rhodobacteraceae bacterium]|nr:endonuclease domain-containing protein [Paracoccaceae bacterium]
MTRISPQTRALARARRAAMTPAARLLWARLRELNRMLGLNFRRQAPIGPHVADFAEFGRRLVLEIDGGGHGGPGDAARDDWLRGEGFAVLRFGDRELRENPGAVMARVLDLLGPGPDAPPPRPSPTRGEGGAAPGERLP